MQRHTVCQNDFIQVHFSNEFMQLMFLKLSQKTTGKDLQSEQLLRRGGTLLSSETSCITGQAHFPESVLFQSQYTFIFLRKGQKMIISPSASYCVIVNLEDPLHFCQVAPTSSKQFLILKEGSMVVKAKHCYQHQSNNQILIWISSLLLQAFPPQWQSKKKNHMVSYVLDHFPYVSETEKTGKHPTFSWKHKHWI